MKRRIIFFVFAFTLATSGIAQFYDTAYYHYPTGGLKAKLALRNDTLNGSADYYNFLGRHIMRCFYKNNLLDSICIGWYGNGNLKFKGYYKQNKPIGKWYYWYRNGVPQCIQKFDNDGQPDSSWLYWYKNRHLKAVEYYRHGKADSVWYSYYKNDSLESKIHYKADSLHGLYQEWYPNGKPSYKAVYDNGKLVGIAMEWYSNGNLTEECENAINDYNLKKEYETKSDTTLILPYKKK